MAGPPEPVEDRLIALIRDRLGVETGPTAPLTSLGVDSLALADFVADLERAFRFRADQDIFDARTVRDLARYIEEQTGAGT